MHKTGVRRIICQSAFGVGDSYGVLPVYYKYLLVPLFMRRVYADYYVQEKHIKESQMDWTIVRPGVLTNDELTGVYPHGFMVDSKTTTVKISRADTADFMLKQLADNNDLHRATCISYSIYGKSAGIYF